ncbi:hypothetical protein BJV82DRAFT_578392 [Fennellomyces sp. T-0311]|nr:hypothetical protein BJV82DRAFT_578392 [Fennellomyces sp. T-0311]
MDMIRRGILVDFISAWPVGQVDGHQSPYLIVGDFFFNLSGIYVDIAFGLTGLVAIYGIKILSTRFDERWPRFKKGSSTLTLCTAGSSSFSTPLSPTASTSALARVHSPF